MARATSRRLRRTEEQREAILQAFEASGLGAWEFCRREGLALSTLQRWRSRRGHVPAPRFVELTPTPAAAPGWALELELPGGVRLRLRG